MVLVVKNLLAKAGDVKRLWFDPWIRKIPWKRAWQPTPVFLPGESLGQRNLVGYSPRGGKESDTTEMTWHACTCSSLKFFGIALLWHSMKTDLYQAWGHC